jgi:hypothetical protein
MYSVILDEFDRDLLDIARSKKLWLVKLVHRAIDGEKINPAALSTEEAKYKNSLSFSGRSTIFPSMVRLTITY